MFIRAVWDETNTQELQSPQSHKARRAADLRISGKSGLDATICLNEFLQSDIQTLPVHRRDLEELFLTGIDTLVAFLFMSPPAGVLVVAKSNEQAPSLNHMSGSCSCAATSPFFLRRSRDDKKKTC